MVKIIGGKEFEPVTSASVPNNSVFMDSSDNAIKVKDNSGSVLDFGVQVPIGSILPWAKDITGVPTLPANFQECDGSAISDAASPMNGQNTPNLNAGSNRMIRGNSTSGGTGGADTVTLTLAEMPVHSHVMGSRGVNSGSSYKMAGGNPASISQRSTNTAGGSGEPPTTQPHNNLPGYTDMVFIIRIK